MISKVRSKIKE